MKTVKFTTIISVYFSRKATIIALRKRAQSVTMHTSLLNVSSHFFCLVNYLVRSKCLLQ